MNDRFEPILTILRANEMAIAWRCVVADPAGAERPGYDDSEWSDRLKGAYGTGRPVAWFRGAIAKSPLMTGVVSARAALGGQLTVWVDGQQVADGFEPTFEMPAPAEGDTLIAIRSELGALSSEQEQIVLFESERLYDIKTARRSLDFVLQWREAQPQHASAIDAALERYAETVDADSYETDPDTFRKQVVAATDILRELDPLAKQYTVHVVPHSHVDLAWGWPYTETKRLAKAFFAEALRLMDEHPDYTFAQDQPPMYEHVEGSETERAVARRVTEGRWDIPGATYGEPESFVPGGESWVRQMLYTKRYFKERYGKDIAIHWAPDNFSGHAGTLPQIWKLCGIEAFAFGNWYQADHGGQFLWEGLDGTRVFAHYFTGHYDSAQMIEQDKVIENVCAHMSSTALDKCMLLDGDDLTPPWPGSPKGLAKLRKLAAFPNIEFSTPHRFFDDVDKTDANLRVETGELISTVGHRHNNVGAYTTFAEVKRRNRISEWGLRTAEALAALAMRAGDRVGEGDYPMDMFRRAWKHTLFNQMHDILPGTAIHEAYDEAYRRYDEVDAVCTEATAAAINVLSSGIDTRGEGIPVVLFNTLSHGRSDPAEVVLTEPHSYYEGFEAVDSRGREVPTQVLSSTIGTFDKTNKTYHVLALPDELPSLGHRTIWLRPVGERPRRFASMVSADALELENDYLRVRIDPSTGWVSSILDKAADREVVPDGKQACALQGTQDMGNPWHLALEGDSWTFNETVATEVVEDGDVRAAIRVTTTWRSSTFVQEFRLCRNSARLEVRTEVDCHDADMVCTVLVPLALPVDATWTSEVPWGAAEREIPDSDRAAHTWTDLSGADVSSEAWGVSLLNDGRYGHSRLEDGTLTLTLLRSVKAHLSDDQTDEGHHEVTYAILPHDGRWQDADTIQQAHALNAPIVALRDIPHEGSLPAVASALSVEPANVVLAALKRAEDDDSWVLHLYESTGRAAEAVLTFDRPVSEATEIDVIEWEPGATVDTDGAAVRRSFRAWEVVALRVRF